VETLRRHRKEEAERRLMCGPEWQDTDLVADRGDGGPVNPVSLSHAFATTLIGAGVNVKAVSEALGHASVAFTMDTYQHVLPAMGEQVTTAIETALLEA
jgi:site-specific recombinase XerD